MNPLILPSLLSADITCLGTEVAAVLQANADMLHIDVMDNHYVPNLTFGPLVCEALHKRFPKAALDIHLMATPVDDLIDSFAAAGANRISIHPDATRHLNRSLQRIRDQNCKAGLVLNPAVSLDCIPWVFPQLDFILIMTVNPGFGGQRLIPYVIEKISAIHAAYPSLPISVDGGVNVNNIKSLAKAGASQFVVGSALFQNKNYAETIARLKANANDE